MDEDDPSARWVERSIRNVGVGHHTPNGPLGCDRPNHTVNGVGTPHPYTSSTKTKSIDIQPRGKRKDDDWTSRYGAKEKGGRAESPLTRSVQENFKGFTYHGGESVVGTMHAAMREREDLKRRENEKSQNGEKEKEEEEEEEGSRSSEDTEKYEDPEISVGRYSQRSSRSRSRKSVTKEKEKSPGKKKGKKHVGFELNEDELDVDGMVAWS